MACISDRPRVLKHVMKELGMEEVDELQDFFRETLSLKNWRRLAPRGKCFSAVLGPRERDKDV